MWAQTAGSSIAGPLGVYAKALGGPAKADLHRCGSHAAFRIAEELGKQPQAFNDKADTLAKQQGFCPTGKCSIVQLGLWAGQVAKTMHDVFGRYLSAFECGEKIDRVKALCGNDATAAVIEALKLNATDINRLAQNLAKASGFCPWPVCTPDQIEYWARHAGSALPTPLGAYAYALTRVGNDCVPLTLAPTSSPTHVPSLQPSIKRAPASAPPTNFPTALPTETPTFAPDYRTGGKRVQEPAEVIAKMLGKDPKMMYDLVLAEVKKTHLCCCGRVCTVAQLKKWARTNADDMSGALAAYATALATPGKSACCVSINVCHLKYALASLLTVTRSAIGNCCLASLPTVARSAIANCCFCIIANCCRFR